ncbi:beta-ketoacyl-ACP reductase [Spirochaetia bacterium]|nr:beta-ketoacyl-ACP reductase [Spirochaetia bacterium]
MVYIITVEKVFAGKNALVIGGSGGIGRAVALGLAERGARLVVHGGSSRERLDGALELVRAAGAEAAGFLYPIGGPRGAGGAGAEDGGPREYGPEAAAAAILKRAQDLSGGDPPDILVCAWGPFKRGNIEDMGPGDWQSLVENNLTFPGIMVSSVLRSMADKHWGRILLFGGTNTDTIRGARTTAVYSAAKTALGALAKSVARTVGGGFLPVGITCNVICPGLTDTEYTGEELRFYNQERSPGGEALKPGDIAKAALWVLENPAVNGGIIPVDRGLVF